jgi:hypothetical protein
VNKLLVILPSPIPELQHAPLAPKCYEPKECAPTPCFFVVFTSNSHLNISRSLGALQKKLVIRVRLNHHGLKRWDVATLLWPSVGVKPNTWKKLGLESFGTPENSEDDLEDQNTSH